MPEQRRFTKMEIVSRLRTLADSAFEPERGRLLGLVALMEHERDLISGTREAIAESRRLIAAVDKLLLL